MTNSGDLPSAPSTYHSFQVYKGATISDRPLQGTELVNCSCVVHWTFTILWLYPVLYHILNVLLHCSAGACCFALTTGGVEGWNMRDEVGSQERKASVFSSLANCCFIATFCETFFFCCLDATRLLLKINVLCSISAVGYVLLKYYLCQFEYFPLLGKVLPCCLTASTSGIFTWWVVTLKWVTERFWLGFADSFSLFIQRYFNLYARLQSSFSSKNWPFLICITHNSMQEL